APGRGRGAGTARHRPRSRFRRGDRHDAARQPHASARQSADFRRRVQAMNRGTLTQLFFTTVDRHAGLPAAFRSKVGGAWVGITHRETLERVQAISLGLRELGIKPGDKVAIISENRPEWALSDYACLSARATDVPIYPTLTAKQTEYILRDSESVAAFVSTASHLEQILLKQGH